MMLTWPDSQSRCISGWGNMMGRGSEEGAGPATAGESGWDGTGSCAGASATPNAKLARHVQARTVRCLAHRRQSKYRVPQVRDRMNVFRKRDAAWKVSFLLALFQSTGVFSDAAWFSCFHSGTRILHESHKALR